MVKVHACQMDIQLIIPDGKVHACQMDIQLIIPDG